LKKDSKIIVPQKGTILFLGLYFGETLLKKDFKIIVPKKRNYTPFFFGETLLKKDSKTIVPPKKGPIFFWKYILAKHFFVSTLVAN